MELHSRTWDVFRCHRDDPVALTHAIGALFDSGDDRLARMLRNYSLVAFPRHPSLVQISERLGLDYDERFYHSLEEGANKSAEVVLALVREIIRFDRVIDLGAGVGAWLRAARHHGAKHIVGIEGCWMTANRVYPEAKFIFSDLNLKIGIPGVYDLAICLEVAEHLRPHRSSSLVSELCHASQVVLFSAALTRQFGDGHINCRSQSFWIRLFAAQGFVCRDIFRPNLWYDHRVEPWYRQNMFLFVGPKVGARFKSFPSPTLLDLYQPQLLFPPVDHYVKLDHQLGLRADNQLCDE